jgi:uncharacterized protein
MRLLTLALVVLAACLSATADEPTKDDRIHVLIVTGEDYPGHLWRETTPAIRRILEQDKRFDVRVVEDPDFLASPAIANYDVIFLHFKNYPPLPHAVAAQDNLANLVKQGKGMILFHFACGAFEDWPEFANLAGRVWDRKTGHDLRGPFTVNVVQPQHPIMREMRDFQADDELYTCLVGDRPVEVLASARSKVTGKDHPMAFVFEYGKGRVFHTPLGHDPRAIEMPGVAELIRRGCLWTANRLP